MLLHVRMNVQVMSDFIEMATEVHEAASSTAADQLS